eukprot:6717539-Lingulodinium_polyedra.AAC.1
MGASVARHGNAERATALQTRDAVLARALYAWPTRGNAHLFQHELLCNSGGHTLVHETLP